MGPLVKERNRDFYLFSIFRAGPNSKKWFFDFGPARKIEKRQKSRFRSLTSGPMGVFYALKKKLGVYLKKPGRRYDSRKKFCEKNFFPSLGIPQKPKMGVKIFFQNFEEKCLIIILRPKWANLGVKWRFGRFLKSDVAISKIGLEPPP